MGRRPRSHPSSGYGLTTILVAGLAFVDSFNLAVRNPQHSRLQSNPRPCPRQQRHVRTTPIRSTCSATPRDSIPDGSPPPRRTSERKPGASQLPTRTPVITTGTRASASKAAVPRLSKAAASTAAAASENVKDSRGNGGRRRTEGAPIEASYGAADRKSKALQQKHRLQRSMGGLEEQALSRGQLLSSLALVGAATAILGGSGVASASTGVRVTKQGEGRPNENMQ